MPASALALLMVAATLHAGWNLVLKQAGDKYVVTWWSLLLGSVCFAPFLFADGQHMHAAWLSVTASALTEAAYFATLAAAYGSADFSVVYPLARGTAPVLLAVWSAIWLGEAPTLFGAAGLLILVFGLIVVGGSGWWSARQRTSGMAGIGQAGLVALLISVYSLIDGAAVRHVAALPYIAAVWPLTAIFATPVVYRRYGWPALVVTARRQWWRIVSIGVLTPIAYLLVLKAYQVAPLSYAGAIREVSIVVAALLGWWWLGEGFGALRAGGALLIFVGIVVIAIAG